MSSLIDACIEAKARRGCHGWRLCNVCRMRECNIFSLSNLVPPSILIFCKIGTYLRLGGYNYHWSCNVKCSKASNNEIVPVVLSIFLHHEFVYNFFLVMVSISSSNKQIQRLYYNPML